MKKLLGLLLLLPCISQAQVTLPYTFTAGSSIKASEANANFSAVANEINTHENAVNPHQTTLNDILTIGNSAGTNNINFNNNQAINMEVEHLTSDPTPAHIGRLFYNTVDQAMKYDSGSAIVTVGGTTITLSSVLTNGNSAGSHNLDMNENQLLHTRVENLGSDPSTGNIGRVWWNTGSSALKVDTGSTIVTIGGSQGLSSVLGVSNSAGSTNLDMNLNQILNLVMEKKASDPGTCTAGRQYYNTGSNVLKFCNGSSWLSVGNTNTLSDTLALGNSVGSNDVNFNNHQAKSMVLFNNNGSPGTGTGGFVWYDTGNSQIGYETSGSNHYLADRDSSQTLTNKVISGSSNTLTNIPDSALSTNACLLDSTQSITGVKTFSTAPIMASIKSTTAATMTIPAGVSSDTFTLNNATQTLAGKTITAPTLTGNTDYSEGQAIHFRVENLSSDPSAGNAGRIYYKTSTGELKYDDGSNTRVLSVGNPTLAQVLTSGNSTGPYNLDINSNQLLNARAENKTSLPSAGNTGRMVFDTTDGNFYFDNGSSWVSALNSSTGWTTTGNAGTSAGTNFIGTTDTQDLVFKTNGTERLRISSTGTYTSNLGTGVVHSNGSGTISSSTVVDADVSASAAITRSKIASGTANHVVINDSGGVLSSEATLAKSRGGTGQDNSSLTFPASGTVQATTPNNHGLLVSGSGATATVVAPDANTNKVAVSGGTSADPSWSLLTNSNLSGSAAISNANLATMAANTVKANVTGGSATPTDVGASTANVASAFVIRDANGKVATGAQTVTGNADEVQSTIKANSSQTANIANWTNSSGTALASVLAAGQFQGPNGSVTTPSFFTATGGGNTGFYFNGSLGGTFGYNGTNVWNCVATQCQYQVVLNQVATGSVTTPTIVFGSNLNTGFYQIGANNWGFTVSNTKLWDWSSALAALTGRETITGSADAVQLTVKGNTAQTSNLQEWQANNGTVEASMSLAGNLTLATPLTVTSGGIGASTLSANAVLLGNGTSSPQTVAPSTSGNVLTSNGTTWISSAPTAAGVPKTSYEVSNLGFATSVSAHAHTIAVKQSDGSTDPSTGGAAVNVGMRSSTTTSGAFNQRQWTGASSIVIPSGASIGHVSNNTEYVWIYALDNSGSLQLGVSGGYFGDEGNVTSTTAISSSSTGKSIIYANQTLTNVPYRLIGREQILENVAGTWDAGASVVSVLPFEKGKFKVYATIGGDSINLGTAAQTSLVGMTDASLSLTNYWSLGSTVPVQIACASTTPSSGNSCGATQESNGISFNIQDPGVYKACVSFGGDFRAATGTAWDITFEIVETPNNAQTITTNGVSPQTFHLGFPSSNTGTAGFSSLYRVCDRFAWTSSGQKTLRLFFAQTGSSQSLINGNTAGTGPSPVVTWEVDKD